jgi:hypothetical protein
MQQQLIQEVNPNEPILSIHEQYQLKERSLSLVTFSGRFMSANSVLKKLANLFYLIGKFLVSQDFRFMQSAFQI